MTDLEKYVDVLARAVATIGMDHITYSTFHTFFAPRGGEKKLVQHPACPGVMLERIGPDPEQFVETFLARFPAWKRLDFGDGVVLNHAASAHARLAWAAFVRDVYTAEGVAS